MRIKIVVVLMVLTVSILADGATNMVVNKSAGVTTAVPEQMRRVDDEDFLTRLRRLSFNASLEDEDTIRLSIGGGDVPVYINANACKASRS